jgi:hypothetical protein
MMRSNQSKKPKIAEVATLAASLVQQGKDPETATVEALRIWDASQRALLQREEECQEAADQAVIDAREVPALRSMEQALPAQKQTVESFLNQYLEVYAFGEKITFGKMLKTALPKVKSVDRLLRLKRILAHEGIEPMDIAELVGRLRGRTWYLGQAQRFGAILDGWWEVMLSESRRKAGRPT